MTRKDDFGDRMKSYEAAYMQRTVPRVPLVIRVDGCHFHSFTRGMAKPFDPILTKTMQDTMLAMCKEITGAVFGYTQSDEITVVCRLADPVNMSEYYEGRVQKILSITASKATLNFNRWFMRNVKEYGQEPDRYPGAADPDVYRRRLMGAEFDSRVMNIPDMDLYNCLIWRQSDATRNSVSMLAQSHYTQRELQGKKRPEMMDMLMLEKGVNWNDLDTVKKRGACCYRKDTGRKRPEWFVDCEMPILSSDEGRERFMPIVLGTAEGAESRSQRCRSRIW